MRPLLFTLIILLCSVFNVKSQEVAPRDSVWKITGENTFLISQSSFSNWASGGINAFSGNLILNYNFNYKKEKWSWDNKAYVGYGFTKQKSIGMRKNDDQINLNSLLGYQAAPRWMYTFFADFKTQFTDGFLYDADGNKQLISTAFAPAYLSFGPGFAYKESDNFYFNLSPAAPRFVFVTNTALSDIGAFGVTPGKKVRTEFGAFFSAYYKVDLMENVSFENALKLYADYLDKPQNVDVDYTANLFMKVNKFVTVNAGLQLIYDDNTLIPFEDNGVSGLHKAVQLKQILGAGLTYKF